MKKLTATFIKTNKKKIFNQTNRAFINKRLTTTLKGNAWIKQ